MLKFPLNTLLVVFFMMVLVACDSTRVYEVNLPLEESVWLKDDIQQHSVAIDDKSVNYAIYLNVRNGSMYPYHNIYVKYRVADTLGNVLSEALVNKELYHSKTGKPLGQSGIGDAFDHQFLLLDDFSFPKNGVYSISLQHYMRTDSLKGIITTGIRVEKKDGGAQE